MSKYAANAKTCIKGEAFFESLIAEYAIPHHIEGPKDIGVDYICEWANGDAPTGILFAAQVKTYEVKKKSAPKSMGVINPTHNALEAFSICNTNLTIKQSTLDYWTGLGLPAYLFVVALTKGGRSLYYKRYSRILIDHIDPKGEHFYRVDDNAHRFKAFAKEETRVQGFQGFARDLFVDLMRWSYSKGSIAWVNPRKLGLLQFPEEENVFDEFVETYKLQITETYSNMKKHLKKHGIS